MTTGRSRPMSDDTRCPCGGVRVVNTYTLAGLVYADDYCGRCGRNLPPLPPGEEPPALDAPLPLDEPLE
jgi:hypothetical protein